MEKDSDEECVPAGHGALTCEESCTSDGFMSALTRVYNIHQSEVTGKQKLKIMAYYKFLAFLKACHAPIHIHVCIYDRGSGWKNITSIISTGRGSAMFKDRLQAIYMYTCF